tara:strand:- start:52 stop:249 length:198 start_codon:yes stop_codon:yes gene_type:complete
MAKQFVFNRTDVIVNQYYIDADNYDQALHKLDNEIIDDYKTIYREIENIKCIENPDEKSENIERK